MTAEERLAYFQGEKRRDPVYQTAQKSRVTIIFKIKFFIAVMLFILFLSLDYTGYEVYGIGSERIIDEVTKDIEISLDFDL